MKIKGSKKKGLTLVEVLVSLAILGIIIVPFLSLIVTSTKITVNSNFKIKATTLAQTIAEYIKNTEFDDINLGEIKLYESGIDKTKFLSKGENPNKILLYDIDNEEYKNMVVKINYQQILEESTKNSNGMSIYFNNSSVEVFYNNNQIDLSNYENAKPLDVSVNVSGQGNNKNLELSCIQQGKQVLIETINGFTGNINFNYPVEGNINTKITALNSTENRVTLNIYKKYNSKANYILTTGGNFTINNFASYNNSVLIKKGDEIGIEIYRVADNNVVLLQQLKVTKVR